MPRKPEPAPNAKSRAVSAEIRAELARRDIDQRDVAAKMSHGPNYLSRKLRNMGSLTVTDVVEICDALDIDVLELIGKALTNAEAARVAEMEAELRDQTRRTDEPPEQNG